MNTKLSGNVEEEANSLSLSLSLSGEHLLVAPLHSKYREHAKEQAGQPMTHHGSRKTFDEQWQSEIETISPNYHRLRTRRAMSNESWCLVVLGMQQSARERERERRE
jgi:hypothetical protein